MVPNDIKVCRLLSNFKTHITSSKLNTSLLKLSNKFLVIILITQTCKTKNITINRYYCIFPVPGKKGKK